MIKCIEINCPSCGDLHSVAVNDSNYNKWVGGELIQNAMPNLTPTEREQLISRICPRCQDAIFV